MWVKPSRVIGQIINLPFDYTNTLSKLSLLQDQLAKLYFPLPPGEEKHLFHFVFSESEPYHQHLVDLQHLTATQLLKDN